MAKARIEVRKAPSGKWYYRFRSSSRTLTHSENYATKSNAVRGAKTFQRLAKAATIEVS
jgi:uncharacterized protein YegP (UPF0339 family)